MERQVKSCPFAYGRTTSLVLGPMVRTSNGRVGEMGVDFEDVVCHLLGTPFLNWSMCYAHGSLP